MGLVVKLILLAVTIGSSFLFYKLIVEPYPRPVVEDEYWGPKSEQGKKEDTSIRPFQINVSQSILDDFKARLKRELDANRFVPPLEGVGFEYGFNTNYLKTLGQYWLTKYDWRAREKLINKYPSFRTRIGGLDIHFLHVKPKARGGKPPRPLLVMHGWPGSFVEFMKIIPLLAEPKNSQYNYELVVPSLPGFGFSDPARRPGLSPTEIANIFKRLMKRLGHDKFYAMGYDWGGIIASDLASVYPENLIAVQSNLCFPGTVMSNIRYGIAYFLPNILISQEELNVVPPPWEFLIFLVKEFGYFHLQATKPDTVGVALTQSPLGSAAYVLDRFAVFTNRTFITREDGGLLENYKMDELLDNLMVYWVTGSMSSSVRLYYEMMTLWKKHQVDRVPTDVPMSCLFHPQEIAILPEFALRDKYTNLHYSIAPKGGHFGPFEVPEIVASNAITHFDKY